MGVFERRTESENISLIQNADYQGHWRGKITRQTFLKKGRQAKVYCILVAES
jgi:hypothetical protein